MEEKNKINQIMAVVAVIFLIAIFVYGLRGRNDKPDNAVVPIQNQESEVGVADQLQEEEIGTAGEALDACLAREEELNQALIERTETMIASQTPQECPAPVEITAIKEVFVPDEATKAEVEALKEKLLEKDLILEQLRAEWQAEREASVQEEFSCE